MAGRLASTNRRNGSSRLRVSRCMKKAAEATDAKMACTAAFAAMRGLPGRAGATTLITLTVAAEASLAHPTAD